MTGLRGHEVLHIEGFSDAVFGFALTLLVVSLEVPEDFGALRRAYRRRAALALTPRAEFDARTSARTHVLSVSVGLLSVLLALTAPPGWLWIPGVLYTLLAPIHATNGYLVGRARARI